MRLYVEIELRLQGDFERVWLFLFNCISQIVRRDCSIDDMKLWYSRTLCEMLFYIGA